MSSRFEALFERLRVSPHDPHYDTACAAIDVIRQMENAADEACDLLAERTHGSAARSPGHNARLRLERGLKQALSSQDREA